MEEVKKRAVWPKILIYVLIGIIGTIALFIPINKIPLILQIIVVIVATPTILLNYHYLSLPFLIIFIAWSIYYGVNKKKIKKSGDLEKLKSFKSTGRIVKFSFLISFVVLCVLCWIFYGPVQISLM